jgi:hypothetical protein
MDPGNGNSVADTEVITAQRHTARYLEQTIFRFGTAKYRMENEVSGLAM